MEGVYGIFIPVVTFSLLGGAAVEQTNHRQIPTTPTGRQLSLELEERNEGEELAVARTLLSDGTRVDRKGVLSTRTSFFEGKSSRMSSTTSWVRATYPIIFRSPF